MNVAIVGAGWSGLQIADVLRACGHEVQVYEALDDVGGTWHPALAYAGLALHTPAFRAQFHGHGPPAGQDPLRRLPAAEVQETCRTFARERGLLPHIALQHRVLRIDWDSARRMNHVTVRDEVAGVERTVDYDHVVSTQFNSPRLPRWPGQETFTGEILHTSAVKAHVLDRLRHQEARVVVVGGSKSATDMALQFVAHALPFTWLLRRMYWFLSYDKGYWDARRRRPARWIYRLLYFVGLGLSRGPVTTRLVFLLWRLVGLLRCPGKPAPGVTAFHHGWLDDGQIETLRAQTSPVYDEIARLEERTIHTRGGRQMACDVLICGTGCDPIATPIELSADGAPVAYSDVEHVYRHSVIPALPRLVFTGYWMFGFGPLNGYHRAAWLLDFMERDQSAEALLTVARAERHAPFMFRRGSFLFDGAANLLTTVKAMNRPMSEGIYRNDDLERYYRDIALRFVYAPIAGARRLVEARQRRRAASPAHANVRPGDQAAP